MLPVHTLMKHTMAPVSCKSIRWVFDCSQWSASATEWLQCLKSIQPEERDRINRFVFRNDAMSSMAGRLLMRKLLVETDLASWRNLRIARSEKGKPYVPGLEHVLFSVSHHGRLTVMAAEVLEGIDCPNEPSEISTTNEDKLATRLCNIGSTSETSENTTTNGDNSERSHFKIGCTKEGTSEKSSTHDDVIESKLGTCTKENLKTCMYQSKTIPNRKDELKSATPSVRESSSAISSTDGACQSARTLPSLGVDICNQELPRNSKTPEFFRLMRRNFHEEEWRYILTAPCESAQLGRFYRLWSLKESYVKATGTGIAVPLDEICFRIATELGQENCKNSQVGCVTDTQVVLRGRIMEDWTFEETRLLGKYCVAVALHGAVPGNWVIDKSYEVVTFGDVEGMMEDVEDGDDEEMFYQAQDFVKKQLRPWD